MLTHRSVRKAALCAAASVGALGFGFYAAPAMAAEPTNTETAAPATTVVGELLITAQKREENLQDVPVAVTAYTADMRDKTGLISASQQLNFTPGVTYTPGADRITVRGVGRITGQIGTDGGVAVYQDGFYVGTAGGLNSSSLGTDRTEILRGPQGTLYGRNSIGGAVNVISRRPDREFTGEMRASINSYEGTVFEGRVSGPISEHLRGSFQFSTFQQEQGAYHDVLPPPHAGAAPGTPNGVGPLLNTATVQPITFENIAAVGDEGVGVGHGWTANAQLAFDFGESFDGWIRYQATESHTRPRDTVGVSPWSLLPLIVPNVFTGFQPDQNPGINDHHAFFANRATDNDLVHNNQVIGEATWHGSGFDVKYIGGYWHYENHNFIDGDATGDPNFYTPGLFGGRVVARNDIAYRTNDTQSSWSHEVNITSTGDAPLQWLVGAYYYDEKHLQTFDVPEFQEPHYDYVTEQLFCGNPLLAAFSPPCVARGPLNNPDELLYAYTADLHTQSSAIFGQVDYRPNDQWHFIAGLRYSHDKKVGYETQYSITQIVLADQATAAGLDALLRGPAFNFAAGWPRYPAGTPFAGQYVMDYVLYSCGYPGDSADPTITPINPTFACPKQRTLSHSWSAPTGTLAVEFSPNADTNLYARYTRGYKSGGYNLGTIANGAIVDAEHIDAVEGGWKQNWGSRFQLNAAIYYYWYHDLQSLNGHLSQVSPPIIINQLVNLEESRSYGIELESHWAPVDNLLILFNYAYVNNQITKACCFVDSSDPSAVQPGAHEAVPGTGAQELAGNRLPNSPRHKVSANISYTFNFEPGSLTLSATEEWHSSSYNSLFNNPHWFVPSGDRTDLRVTWKSASKHYEIIGTVTNVFDKEIVTAFTTLPPNQNFYQLLSLAPMRTFTVEARFHF